MSESPIDRRPKNRSPNYPGIGLEKAIARASTIFDREGRNPVPLDALYEHWGFSSKSSTAMMTVAALTKFGLLDDSGKGSTRKARISSSALQILLDRDSPETQQLLREAALKPAIHQELWNRFPDGLPSDTTMRIYLVNERRFTLQAANDLIAEFRSTLAFVGLSGSATDANSGEDDLDVDMSGVVGEPTTEWAPFKGIIPKKTIEPKRSDATRIVIPIPLDKNEVAALQLPTRMTERQWDAMMGLIAAYKAIVVMAGDAPAEEA
jgi:hypothetical protein